MSPRVHLFLLLAVMATALAACSSGKPRRLYPPTASIQQIDVRADGSWDIALRVQNFSNVGMRIARIEAQLLLGGEAAGRIDEQPGVIAPAGSAEILSLRMQPTPAARARVAAVLAASDRRSVGYALEGTIHSSEPTSRHDAFEFASALAPVPGLPDTLR